MLCIGTEISVALMPDGTKESKYSLWEYTSTGADASSMHLLLVLCTELFLIFFLIQFDFSQI